MSTTIIFSGYLAELLKLQAEKRKISAEELVVSFFVKRCIAPNKTRREVHCTAPAAKGRRAAV